MKRVEKQRRPLVFRVGLEGGMPSLQVVNEELVQAPPVEEVFPETYVVTENQISEMQTEDQMVETPVAVDAIFVNREGSITGPFTEKELRRHWANGVIYSDDYVWKEGMEEWVVLGSYFGVPVLSSTSASVSTLSRRRTGNADYQTTSGFIHSWIALPAVFSILSMLCALFFIILIPENKIYFATACGMTLVLALVVCLMGRKLSLVVLMLLNVLLPVLAWYYLIKDTAHEQPPGNTVEQKEEDLPASVTKQVASKKV